MPFDIGESINYLADAFLRAPIVKTIASNPIYTALVITFIVMLITMFMFRSAETEEPFLKTILSTGFWVFLACMGVLFLHNRVLGSETETISQDKIYDGLFAGADEENVQVLEDSVVSINARKY